MRRGCLIALTIIFSAPLALCQLAGFHERRSKLPAALEWDQIVAFDESVGITDGCVFGLYHLTPRGVAHAGRWLATPAPTDKQGNLADGTHLYALAATGGCDSGDPAPVEAALRAPGNRYRVFNGGEGLIVVETSTRLAWYLYFG